MVCEVCQLRRQCVAGKSGRGRTIRLHPQERLIQEARALQQSEEYDPYRKLRQVAEHKIARLAQLGIRQARYFGRVKPLFQLLLAATVANLTLLATKTGLMRSGKRRGPIFVHGICPLWQQSWSPFGCCAHIQSRRRRSTTVSQAGFRLDF